MQIEGTRIVDDALEKAFNDLRSALSAPRQQTESPQAVEPLFASAEVLGR